MTASVQRDLTVVGADAKVSRVSVQQGYHVQKAADITLAPSPGLDDKASGLTRATLVGRQVGAVHTGFALVRLEPGGHVDVHVHSTEQSFYVIEGNPAITIDGRPYRLAADDCGLAPVGVQHGWRNESDAPAMWLEMNAPSPRLSGPPDTFWTGQQPPTGAQSLDIRDPRTRTFFRLGPGQMDVDQLKIGAAVDAPTVSSSMATALLAYSGIAVKMLVDNRLGAVLHSMFMVEYQPGGVAQPHDHPLEETYYILEGEVVAMAEDEEFTLGPGDVFWTGVGCRHAFYNRSERRVRWLETQSPQLPANHSYRFDRDWDYLAQQLGGGRA
jgi:quercetin dioxygenase-like cupin family protein